MIARLAMATNVSHVIVIENSTSIHLDANAAKTTNMVWHTIKPTKANARNATKPAKLAMANNRINASNATIIEY